MRELVAHHLCGALEFERLEQPAIRVEAHHYRFAFQRDIEALLHLSVFARYDAHCNCARLRCVFVSGCLVRSRNGEGQVDWRDKTGSEIIDLLRLLDLQFGHVMLAVP